RKEPSLSALCLDGLFLKAGWSFCNGSPLALQRQPFQPLKGLRWKAVDGQVAATSSQQVVRRLAMT
ncbi:hypothetical protein, partial [Segatella baroniae]|uniref:hypothetical protein n=1 Tax=Segatella baroniae TaxID=305719 RepID=UPI0028E1FC20